MNSPCVDFLNIPLLIFFFKIFQELSLDAEPVGFLNGILNIDPVYKVLRTYTLGFWRKGGDSHLS